MKLFEVAIKGVSPLIQNRFNDVSEDKTKKKEYNDEDEAKQRLYINQNIIYQPAEHIERAMQKAGVNFKYSGKKSFLDFIKSGIFINPDFIPHKIQGYEIDKRPVNIMKMKIMRCRPIFKEWELDFNIECINDDISEKTLNEILVYAGKFIGIGDYRPRYGRFIITKFNLR
jgi:hypothetical protein